MYEHLKGLRKRRGLTQTQVAAKLRLKQSRYAAIENNPLSVSTGQLLNVLTVLGADILIRLRSSKRKPIPKSGDW